MYIYKCICICAKRNWWLRCIVSVGSGPDGRSDRWWRIVPAVSARGFLSRCWNGRDLRTRPTTTQACGSGPGGRTCRFSNSPAWPDPGSQRLIQLAGQARRLRLLPLRRDPLHLGAIPLRPIPLAPFSCWLTCRG
jgi:hypothetical protein